MKVRRTYLRWTIHERRTCWTGEWRWWMLLNDTSAQFRPFAVLGHVEKLYIPRLLDYFWTIYGYSMRDRIITHSKHHRSSSTIWSHIQTNLFAMNKALWHHGFVCGMTAFSHKTDLNARLIISILLCLLYNSLYHNSYVYGILYSEINWFNWIESTNIRVGLLTVKTTIEY